MLKMSKKLLFGSLIIGGLLFGGCGLVAQPADTETESPVQTITGKIGGVGAAMSITSNGKLIEITSRKIDLSKYSGQEVTVVGEFSGSTLYVDEVR